MCFPNVTINHSCNECRRPCWFQATETNGSTIYLPYISFALLHWNHSFEFITDISYPWNLHPQSVLITIATRRRRKESIYRSNRMGCRIEFQTFDKMPLETYGFSTFWISPRYFFWSFSFPHSNGSDGLCPGLRFSGFNRKQWKFTSHGWFSVWSTWRWEFRSFFQNSTGESAKGQNSLSHKKLKWWISSVWPKKRRSIEMKSVRRRTPPTFFTFDSRQKNLCCVGSYRRRRVGKILNFPPCLLWVFPPAFPTQPSDYFSGEKFSTGKATRFHLQVY